MHKQLQSVHIFEQDVHTRMFNKDKLQVKLTINHQSKTFSIEPYHGNEKYGFRFLNGSAESFGITRWLTLNKLIEEAILFADNIFNGTKTI